MSDDKQLSPDQITENELICERLLRWDAVRSPLVGTAWHADGAFVPTPRFTTWAEAGLILEALSLLKDGKPRCGQRMAGNWYCVTRTAGGTADTGPLAVRAAALEYIRGQS